MIVVTTPTGAIGRQVLDRLLAGGDAVRAIARDPSRLPPAEPGRFEVVVGSHGDTDVVNRAFEGADSVLWVVPPNPHMDSLDAAYLEFTRPASAAMQRHGIKRVVGVSALGRGLPVARNAGFVTAALAMDDLIASTGVNYRALAMPSFMDNLLRQVEPIRARGLFFSPLDPDRKHPTCATRDIAAVATKLLQDSSWSGRADVPVLGPEDLSCNDMAQIMSEVLGREVRFQQLSLESFKARLKDSGMSNAFIQGYADMMAAKNAGLDDAEPRTPQSSTPTSFRQWCAEVLKPAVVN
ncbi:MAG: NAD(P)H-binding protein [Pseudorhodoplanes sp.]|nr:NAD(P)H-binding protein [Pseudorhodoplanes sp.]